MFLRVCVCVRACVCVEKSLCVCLSVRPVSSKYAQKSQAHLRDARETSMVQRSRSALGRKCGLKALGWSDVHRLMAAAAAAVTNGVGTPIVIAQDLGGGGRLRAGTASSLELEIFII